MPSYNRVTLMGHVTSDPVLTYTANDKAVCELGLAVNDRVKQEGEWIERVSYVELTLWERRAEVARDYLRTGSPLLIEGRLQQERWEQDGKKRSRLKVVVTQLVLLDKRPKDAGSAGSKEPTDPPDEEVRF